MKDGKEFKGIAFGAPISLEAGEVVFNTGIPGYQEILTDPSYNGQIVTLISPMIGNYGVKAKDSESGSVKATALIIKKLYRGPVIRDRVSLDTFLKDAGIPGIEGIDTRALTLHLREHGSQNGILFYEEDRAEAEAKLQLFPEITERDLISDVAVKEECFNPPLGEGFPLPPTEGKMHFALVDFGVKKSIIANLYKRNISVTLY
ncbi:MAG: carbamoyl phosphate synthase small subunit, partial [Spirochaetales bacterium]|nr:carbamoyl phosphate synthase small subunit [Candidatus Physcosoma equi]